jgi:ribonuclease P protein component
MRADPLTDHPARAVVGRLVQRRDYLRVAATRKRAAVPGLVLQVAPSDAGPDAPPRIGYTASRKVGNAVRRNRARRRLKAAAALIMPVHAGRGRDYVVIAREGTADRPWPALLDDFRKALGRLGAFTEAG